MKAKEACEETTLIKGRQKKGQDEVIIRFFKVDIAF
jgi:hypothetical protein